MTWYHSNFCELAFILCKYRGVATNNGLGGPGSNRDLFCVVSANVELKSITFLNRVNNIEYNVKQNICTGMEVISLILYIKTVTLKNDASSELKRISENEDSQFYFLHYRSYFLRSVTPISEIKAKKVFDNILRKCFLNGSPIFLD